MQMEEFWWQGMHISLIFAVLIPSGNSEKLHLLKKTKGGKKGHCRTLLPCSFICLTTAFSH